MVKLNNRKTASQQFNTRPNFRIDTISVLIAAVSWLQLPAYAGPQSLLDPYASIQAPQAQTEAEPLGDRKSTKMPGSKSRPLSVRSSAASKSSQLASTTNSASANSANPGILSGIREIQHGCVNSFKATVHAIANGSKSMGTKVAPAFDKAKDGMSAAGHKIVAAPKALTAKMPFNRQKNQSQALATANSQAPSSSFANSSSGKFPGKPLSPIVTKPTHTAKVKVNPAAKTKTAGKTNLVSRTFNKFNVFSRHKNAQGNMTATNPNALSR